MTSAARTNPDATSIQTQRRSGRILVLLSDSANAPTVLDSEAANAWRIAQHHGYELLHVQGQGFKIYKEGAWRDGGVAAKRIGTNGAKYLEAEAQEKFSQAAKAITKKERDALMEEGRRLLAYRRKSEQTITITGVLKQVEVLLNEPSDQFDRHDELFNVLNGTIDLEVGVLRPHDPDDLLTCCADVLFDREATCPLWNAFTRRVLPNRATRRYLQKAIGYALSGSVREQAMFVLYGRGANGKSTLLTTIVTFMGASYAARTAPELLMASGGLDRHPTEVADLSGIRLGYASEAEVGRIFAMARVKELTGEVLLKARRMRQDPFMFRNTVKLFLALNDLPIVRDTSEGAWRRLKVIPFTETFGPDERDTDLLEKLLLERSGILNWALEGYRLYREEGLEDTPEMLESLSAYRQEMDSVQRFIDEACEIGDPLELKTPAGELYPHYLDWCKASGVTPVGNAEFKRQVQEKGYPQKKNGGSKFYKGIRPIERWAEAA